MQKRVQKSASKLPPLAAPQAGCPTSKLPPLAALSTIKGNFPGKESHDSITMVAYSKTARFKSTCISLINFTVALQS